MVENVFGPLATEWEDFAVQPDDFVCNGETGIVIGTYHGRYPATSRTLTARFAHAWQLRDGRAVRFEQITDTVRRRHFMD